MKKTRYFTIAALLAGATLASAQTLNSAYFTTDMKTRHTMNPAFGNEQSYVSLPALSNINVRTQGNFGMKDVMFDNPRPLNGKTLTTFMNPYLSDAEALGGLAKGNNRVVGDVNITLLSTGFKAWGGYNTIELNAKARFGASLPYELFAFARNIGNKTYDIGEINAQAMGYAELAFGHSRNINEKLRIGAKVKLLFGAGRADLKMTNVKADLAADNQWVISGEAQADLSLKGAQLQSKVKDYKDPARGQYQTVDNIKVKGAGLGGFGMAFDLGAAYRLNDDWTFSAALLDIGFISWSNDIQARNSGQPFLFDGFHDVSVKESRDPNTFKKQGNDYRDQLTDFINVKDQGDQGGRTTGIGATLNLGAEYTLPVYRKITFGALSSTRINGPYSWTEGRLSANWTPLKWLDGGVSFAVNSFTASMGWVLNIHPSGYNFFVGMDHILGKTSKQMIPLSSNASIALGMNITW